MNGVQFEQAINAAIVANYGKPDQAVVKGVKNLKPYGITNSVQTVEEFRQPFSSKYLGTGDLGTITYGGNDILGDTNGQDYLKKCALDKTLINDIRFYRNTDDFFMADLASDENSGFQISKHDVGEADVNGIYSFSGEAIVQGQPATFAIHHSSSTMVIADDSGGDTLTDASADFITAGIKVGDTVILENPTAEADKLRQITVATVTETILTFTCKSILTAQATGTDMIIHAGRF